MRAQVQASAFVPRSPCEIKQKAKRTSSSLAARERASKLRSSSSAVFDDEESPASSGGEETRSCSTSTSSRRPAAYTGPCVALAVDLLPREGEDDDEHEGEEAAGGAEGDEFASGARSLEEAARATMVLSGLCRRALLLQLQHGADGGGRCSMAARAISSERVARKPRERERTGEKERSSLR